MKTLLLEIGTEEIPAGYIDPALAALSATLVQKLDEARVSHGEVRSLGTPRRLAVIVEDLAPRQKPLVSEITGPPRNVAYDSDGRPTMAAVKFAEKAGVPVERLKVKSTPKGDYLSAVITEPGVATTTFLKGILPAVILATPFPKSMRWADLAISFARPIVSILALYGKSVVGFEVGTIRSGRTTCGHRFMHPAKIKINDPSEYREALRAAYVVVDAAERRDVIATSIAKAAESVGGRILPDEDLLATVTHLVEFPAVTVGRFAEEYLELPDEVLITAMRVHQKYFAVADAAGRLRPNFIAVSNTPARDMAVVARGLERVLRARLEDAKFFYRTDKAIPLDHLAEKLKNVLFQAQLGSIHAKTERIGRLAVFLAERTGGDPQAVQLNRRAAQLCKADLVSHMVGEFPKLQGVMGRVYAKLQGEPTEVAAAIEEHYRPVSSGAALPQSTVGALLALADKLDTICGCFHAGLLPTGAADPYALRRQAIGILQILRARNITLPLGMLVEAGLEPFEPGRTAAASETGTKVCAFFESRMASIMAEDGFDKDTVAAVLGVGLKDVPAAWRRVDALQQLKDKPDFEPIAVSFKRVVNIIRRAEGFVPRTVEEGLLAHPSESGLLAAYRAVHGQVQDDLSRGRYAEALARVATLRPPVDTFFDDVMVMAEDAQIRQNRLSLLALIAGLFDTFADFSKLSA
jgi:glycyl-tRNA synthetase beta chain